ncbi:MAG: hypothetical protein HYZ90_00960 [Candidatus Omnitrophica bacterium]|nr:hypothetical protein [Candidatus Omnitrophota bacterium]
MTTLASPVAQIDLENLPKSSLVRLYDPATPGNSFMLDGFPALAAGGDWLSPEDAKPLRPPASWLSRLVEVIETRGPLGMTTNQTLFRQLVETRALDGRLRALKAEGRPKEEIYRILYNEAAVAAARAFSAIHARWPWEGRVSQEASALLRELDPLVRDVLRISKGMSGVGAFTKIPNLPVGPQAIEKAVVGEDSSDEVHPNVTLVFSDRHYLQTVEGYLSGLEKRSKVRGDLSRIRSVNSLFVSRVDRVVDPMINEVSGTGRVPDTILLLKGKVAVSQAKKIYQMFEAVFLGVPFEDPAGLYADPEGKEMMSALRRLQGLFARLKGLGAHPQRLLIASSGVKADQPYSPLLYVLPFLGPWSANTMPEGTLEAASRFVGGLSDSQVRALRGRNLMREPLPDLPAEEKEAWERALLLTPAERKASGIREVTPDQILRDAKKLIFDPKGTSLRAICDTLRDKGAASFTADEEATLQALEATLQAL